MQLRRNRHELRIETMPLIDVVFLLLTFFIFAVTVMDRTEALPMETTPLRGAGRPEVPPAATISVDDAGEIFLDREPVAADDLIPELRRRLDALPNTVIYIAAARDGTTDRLPTFIDLYGRLAEAGIPVALVSLGAATEDGAPAAGAGPPAGSGPGPGPAASPAG